MTKQQILANIGILDRNLNVLRTKLQNAINKYKDATHPEVVTLLNRVANIEFDIEELWRKYYEDDEDDGGNGHDNSDDHLK